MNYTSVLEQTSTTCGGVRFTVPRMSLARRIELSRRIREVGLKSEYLQASSKLEDQIESGLIQRKIERLYLEWGLVSVSGMQIDDEEATPASVIERGPECLVAEILAAIKAQLYLSETERKN